MIGTSNTSWSQLDLFRVSSPASLTPTLSTVTHINTANQGQPVTQPHLGKHRRDREDRRQRQSPLRSRVSGRKPLDGHDRRNDRVGRQLRRDRQRQRGHAERRLLVGVHGDPDGLDAVDQPGGHRLRPRGDESELLQLRRRSPPTARSRRPWGSRSRGTSSSSARGRPGGCPATRLGALQGINVYGPGVAAYNPAFDSGASRGYRRWGDYSFTRRRPVRRPVDLDDPGIHARRQPVRDPVRPTQGAAAGDAGLGQPVFRRRGPVGRERRDHGDVVRRVGVLRHAGESLGRALPDADRLDASPGSSSTAPRGTVRRRSR